jgi:hypothetical protein
VFQCISNVGTQGCGFEQPLEAMKLALTPAINPGFTRSDAHTAIVILTEEDDCSIADYSLLTGDNATFGYMGSFRCTEFGIKCDEPFDNLQSLTYNNCTSKTEDDPDNYLFTTRQYVDFLKNMKHQTRTLVSIIAGPFFGSISTTCTPTECKVSKTCDNVLGGGVPGVRLYNFVDMMKQDPYELQWAYDSICQTNYNWALSGLAFEIRNALD